MCQYLAILMQVASAKAVTEQHELALADVFAANVALEQRCKDAEVVIRVFGSSICSKLVFRGSRGDSVFL